MRDDYSEYDRTTVRHSQNAGICLEKHCKFILYGISSGKCFISSSKDIIRTCYIDWGREANVK